MSGGNRQESEFQEGARIQYEIQVPEGGRGGQEVNVRRHSPQRKQADGVRELSEEKETAPRPDDISGEPQGKKEGIREETAGSTGVHNDGSEQGVGGLRLLVDYKRQTDIYDPEEHADIEVTIAGAGNIGSHTALALARMGIKKLHIWDFDEVEAHNLSSQSYPTEAIGVSKVIALSKQIHELNPDIEIFTYNAPFTGKEQKGSILVSAVDSMEIRRGIAKNLPMGTYVVDGRMGGGQIEVWSQPGSLWGLTLTKDGDADPCSARYISYTSYIIAGLIANNVKRHILGQTVRGMILMHTDTLQVVAK